jgi:hypothetical protein
MSDKDFYNLVDFYNAGGGLLPANERAQEIMEQLASGEIVSFKEITARDLKRHRCYFSLLKFIWGYMPLSFKKAIPEGSFYLFLKHLKKEYKVVFTFQDGTTMVEYDSISFGKMSEIRFREYVKEQLPFIYSDVIGKYFDGEIYNNIIETIEIEYDKFLSKL